MVKFEITSEVSSSLAESRRLTQAPVTKDGENAKSFRHYQIYRETAVLTLVIGILIIVVLGAILFWVIDKFCPDARLAQLLKLLVVLVCLGAIVARVLPLLGSPSFL
jgi:uncharacterized membrane protein YqjE